MSSVNCRWCGSSALVFLEGKGSGFGEYRCSDCNRVFVTNTPFVELSDEEAELVAEIAFGANNPDIEQEVSDRRKFAEGKASEIRALLAGALDTGAAERYFDEEKVEALYDRLTDEIYPESRKPEHL